MGAVEVPGVVGLVVVVELGSVAREWLDRPAKLTLMTSKMKPELSSYEPE